MKAGIKAILLIISAGAIGLIISTLFFALFIETNEPIEEWVGAFWWFFIYYLPAGPVFYIPVMLALRQLLKGYRPAWLFPATAILAGLSPSLLFSIHWGGGFGGIEVLLLTLAMYAPVGVVFGSGFVWL